MLSRASRIISPTITRTLIVVALAIVMTTAFAPEQPFAVARAQSDRAPISTVTPRPTTSTAREQTASPVASPSPAGDGMATPIAAGTGNSFQSQFYPLTMEWEDPWQQIGEVRIIGEEEEELALTNGVSYLYLQTYPWEGTAAQCVGSSIDQYTEDLGYYDTKPAIGSDGSPIGNTETGRRDAYSAITVTYQPSGAIAQDYGVFIHCFTSRTVPDVIARFQLFAPPDDLEAQILAFVDFLAGVRFR